MNFDIYNEFLSSIEFTDETGKPVKDKVKFVEDKLQEETKDE